jgi:prepilin-type N-terminal cleavage/methylation domain-containing protein
MSRRGFSLLEVMVALAILIGSVALLVESQSAAAIMTFEAERFITATDLAVSKMAEARLLVESEGFQVSDIEENGDFSDYGGDARGLDFDDQLDGYHWEYSIMEIDLALAGDVAGMMSELDGSGMMGGTEDSDMAAMGGGDAMSQFAAIGMSGEALTEMLAPYFREVRVRVWWGDSADESEEDGKEVVLTGHVINPTGIVQLEQQMGGGE